jgi:WD40 repeat protein
MIKSGSWFIYSFVLLFSFSEVVSLLFSKKGDLIYTAGADGVMSVFDSKSGEAKSKFKASKKRINSLSISCGKLSYITWVQLHEIYMFTNV